MGNTRCRLLLTNLDIPPPARSSMQRRPEAVGQAVIDLNKQELQRPCNCLTQCWKWSGKRMQCISVRPSFGKATRSSSARECFPQKWPWSKGRATSRHKPWHQGQMQHGSKAPAKVTCWWRDKFETTVTSSSGSHREHAIRMPALEESTATGGTRPVHSLMIIASHVFSWKSVIIKQLIMEIVKKKHAEVWDCEQIDQRIPAKKQWLFKKCTRQTSLNYPSSEQWHCCECWTEAGASGCSIVGQVSHALQQIQL